MGMNVGSGGSGDPDVMIEVNMTPLIDVMLVLIIMLIITIPIQNHSVNLNLPVGTPPPPKEEPVVHTIDIDFDGSISWDGALVNGSALNQQLITVGNMMPKDAQPEVHVKPNRLVEYKYVAAVMAMAQRDGVAKIGMIGNEQFVGN
jgi:biopolymer transport protein ExbD